MSIETEPPRADYAGFLQNAVSLIRDGIGEIEHVESDELPTTDAWLQEAVRLTLEADRDSDPQRTQTEYPTAYDEIPWTAVFEEFGFYDQSVINAASQTQLAGAIATSEHTGVRPDSFGRQPQKETVQRAAEHGYLTVVEREGSAAWYLPAEVTE